MLANRVRMVSIPKHTRASDDDFSGTSNGNFRYIGTDEYIIIPNVIKGIAVTSYYRMFLNNSVVKGVVSDNTNVTDMNSMFYGNKVPEIVLSSFNTSNVTNMFSMFYNSLATKLDLSNFNTSKVTNMSSMFHSTSATTLDLSSFDTSNVTNMSGMFYNSLATKLDLSNFNTSKVTNMSQMFSNSLATKLDLSSFNTSNVTNMWDMFQNSAATTGYARTQADANKFNTSSNKPPGLTFIVKP